HWLRRSQRTNLHGAEAVGSFGRAGRGPTPPSSTAAPSGTPPRRGLRGVQSPTGLPPRGHQGTPVSAAAREPVRAAADTAPSLDCPRARSGYQASFLAPVGSTTRSNSRCALPVPLVPVTPPSPS